MARPGASRVYVGGSEVFFKEQLRDVGHRLKQTGGANAIGARPILDQRADAALRVNAVRDHGQDDEKDDPDNLGQRGRDEKIIHGRS